MARKKKTSILEFVPKGIELRPIQVEALLFLEREWSSADVFTLDLPVGSGKSWIAEITSRWLRGKGKSSVIMVPENSLLDQYVEAFPSLPSIYKKEHYTCDRMSRGDDVTKCVTVKKHLKKHCMDCPYTNSLRKFRAIPYGVTNFHLMMAHRLRRDVLIIDEAHTLLPFLQDLASHKVWKHVWKWPDSLRSYGDVSRWVEGLERGQDVNLTLEALRSVFSGDSPNYLVKRTREAFGQSQEDRELLKLIPLDVSTSVTGNFIRDNDKLILMSATLGDQDIRDMGLDRRIVKRFASESPIPPDRRPVVVHPVLRLAAGQVDSSMEELIETVEHLVEHHEGEGGMIHLPYSLASRLRQQLSGRNSVLNSDRIIWHDRESKRAAVEELKKSTGRVLVSSGLYEGIDLRGSAHTWQVIVKVPWPYLGDPAIKWKAGKDPKWYAWQASRLILQACGRICRGPDDYGLTYIVDQSFKRLYNENEDHFPEWWKSGIM